MTWFDYSSISDGTFSHDATVVKTAILDAKDRVQMRLAEESFRAFTERYETMENGDSEQRSTYFNTIEYLSSLLEGKQENFINRLR